MMFSIPYWRELILKNNNLTHFCKNVSKAMNVPEKLHKICVSILPAAAIVAFASTVMYWNSRNYGLVLAYGGREFATVQNENEFQKAAQLAQEQMLSGKNSERSIPSPECKVTMLTGSNYVSPIDIKDKLLEESRAAVENAFGLYVDGTLIGIVRDKALLENLLNSILENAKSGNSSTVSEFVEKIEIIDGIYLSSEICDIASLSASISDGVAYETEYIATEGDTLESIAQKFNTTVESIYENNHIVDSKVEPGQSLCVVYFNKMLHIKTTQDETSEIEIPYSSVTSQSADDYIGTTKILQSGKNGLKTLTQKVTYIDGNEVSREDSYETVSLEPIDEHISVGAKKKEKPKNKIDLCWPVPFTHNVTSGYGPRDGGFHKGIDIASHGVGGKEIVAAEDGVVETVANGGGYGNHIVVRHNDNTCTLYAHCSSVSAKKGQTVSKGQKIANVGSTGNSTGNHLHFEVIVRGKNVNPMNFFK